jgi:hypothetical protein
MTPRPSTHLRSSPRTKPREHLLSGEIGAGRMLPDRVAQETKKTRAFCEVKLVESSAAMPRAFAARRAVVRPSAAPILSIGALALWSRTE